MRKMYNSTSGDIKLFSNDLNLISTRRYFSIGHRREVLKNWEQIYGKEKFSYMVIQISPRIDKSKDDKFLSKIERMQNGTYGRRHKKK